MKGQTIFKMLLDIIDVIRENQKDVQASRRPGTFDDKLRFCSSRLYLPQASGKSTGIEEFVKMQTGLGKSVLHVVSGKSLLNKQLHTERHKRNNVREDLLQVFTAEEIAAGKNFVTAPDFVIVDHVYEDFLWREAVARTGNENTIYFNIAYDAA